MEDGVTNFFMVIVVVAVVIFVVATLSLGAVNISFDNELFTHPTEAIVSHMDVM